MVEVWAPWEGIKSLGQRCCLGHNYVIAYPKITFGPVDIKTCSFDFTTKIFIRFRYKIDVEDYISDIYEVYLQDVHVPFCPAHETKEPRKEKDKNQGWPSLNNSRMLVSNVCLVALVALLQNT